MARVYSLALFCILLGTPSKASLATATPPKPFITTYAHKGTLDVSLNHVPEGYIACVGYEMVEEGHSPGSPSGQSCRAAERPQEVFTFRGLSGVYVVVWVVGETANKVTWQGQQNIIVRA